MAATVGRGKRGESGARMAGGGRRPRSFWGDEGAANLRTTTSAFRSGAEKQMRGVWGGLGLPHGAERIHACMTSGATCMSGAVGGVKGKEWSRRRSEGGKERAKRATARAKRALDLKP